MEDPHNFTILPLHSFKLKLLAIPTGTGYLVRSEFPYIDSLANKLRGTDTRICMRIFETTLGNYIIIVDAVKLG